MPTGCAAEFAEVAHLAVGEMVWDDAVRHLDNAYDPDWARQNIGVFFWQNCRFEASFILSAVDHAVFAARKGDALGLP